jgi:hypothetical protein
MRFIAAVLAVAALAFAGAPAHAMTFKLATTGDGL